VQPENSGQGQTTNHINSYKHQVFKNESRDKKTQVTKSSAEVGYNKHNETKVSSRQDQGHEL
jgi:hypothetical protein